MKVEVEVVEVEMEMEMERDVKVNRREGKASFGMQVLKKPEGIDSPGEHKSFSFLSLPYRHASEREERAATTTTTTNH